ncbi:hypothetical protein G3I13_01910 [Streptomyces sp. SID6673]|nr:hypothetical protein [Streptomyces sp. SID11726]NDZ94916.1 hypothetical protein [Streptomyces sp. SID11726]NEB23076.1 hypothetical protein [Streptomyces sp. SID6673]
MKIEPMSPDEIVRNIRKHMEMYPDQATELVDGLRQVVVERTPDTTPNRKQELREKIEDIQGHCMHERGHDCWYFQTLSRIREKEWDEDEVDRIMSSEQDGALEQLLADTVKAEVNKVLDEMESKAVIVTSQTGASKWIPLSAIEQVRKEVI